MNGSDVFVCPFCQGHFSVLPDDSVAHTAPACEEFKKAIDFVVVLAEDGTYDRVYAGSRTADDTMDFVQKANDKIYADAGESEKLAKMRRDD